LLKLDVIYQYLMLASTEDTLRLYGLNNIGNLTWKWLFEQAKMYRYAQINGKVSFADINTTSWF